MQKYSSDNNCSQFRLDNQNGSILALIAILAVVLITFVAMVIDLNSLAEARERAIQFSKLAALAAIEDYFEAYQKSLTDSPDEPDTNRREAAFDRAFTAANDVFNRKINSGDPVQDTNLLLTHPKRGDLPGTAILSAAGHDSLVPGHSGAKLETGNWKWACDENDTSCQESEEQKFIPLADSDQRTGAANAIRIKGELFTPLATKIASAVTSIKEFPISVEAVATVIPRHICFLVDMSPSTVRETHFPREDVNQEYGSEAAFFLALENPPAILNQSHDKQWEKLNAKTDRPLSEKINPIPTKHYKDDYRKKLTLDDADYDYANANGLDYIKHHPSPYNDDNSLNNFSVPQGSWYHIDTFRVNDKYEGPQPLNTIFRGLNRAIQTLQDRHVAGDQACLIFYDNFLSWPRIVNLTDDFDYLLKITDSSKNGEIPDDAITIKPNEMMPAELRGLELLMRHQLFPKAYSHTNMRLALQEAMRQLESRYNPNTPTSQSVVFIGDGLSNCCSTGQPGDDPLCSSGNVDPDTKACCPAENSCSNSYDFYKSAMSELLKFTQNDIVKKEIPLHFILAGNSVAPHTLKIPCSGDQCDGAAEGTCLTDFQARKLGIPYVMGGTKSGNTDLPQTGTNSWTSHWDNMSPDKPFYQVNADLYKLASATQGLWAPIRPTESGCSYIAPSSREPLNDCSALGGDKRRVTDPYCRTFEQQIDEYLIDIIGQNPYTLVADKIDFPD